MKTELQINKKIIITFLIATFVFVFINQLHIDSYIKNFTVPFMIMVISYLFLFKNIDFRNKKSYYLLIPIILILVSSFIPIDGSNRFLNLIVLPILLSIFFSLLTNPNYRISEQSFNWFFKLFPKDLYHNLKYIQIKKGKNKKY